MAILLIFLVFTAVSGQVLQSTSINPCYDNDMAIRCEPPTRSFSFNKPPQVNSTCGLPPSNFCTRRLINSITRSVAIDCTGVCDSSNPSLSHPAVLMTDFLLNEESWWQSENSIDPQNIVVIDLALQTLVEVSVITFNFVSFKPGSFYILKSDDFGESYTPYHYFATDCVQSFGLDPEQMLTSLNETVALCQTIGSFVPGSISFFPEVGRPSTNDSVPGYSSILFDFLTVTNIRVVLFEHYAIPDLPPDDLGYYYAISDLNLVGSCQCHGHASTCEVSLETYQFECDCQHNTVGRFCERCAVFYQDIPWRRANGVGDFECRACECSGHSSECVFDAEVYELSGQISGGVCINCSDNTAGRQCEECAPLHYRIPDLPHTHVNTCQACNCHLPGVTDNGECTQETTATLGIGQCSCKPNVIGQRCDQCAPSMFNLTVGSPAGCQECGCNANGSLSLVCDTVSGVCDCKPNVVGDKCNQCLPNHYQPDPMSSQGCLACDCNPGGSYSSTCHFLTGQCDCKNGVTGRTCSETLENYFFPSVDYIRLEAEQNSDSQVIEPSGENVRFTGIGYASIFGLNDQLEIGALVVPASGLYEAVIRYTLHGITSLESLQLTVVPELLNSGQQQNCSTHPEITSPASISYTALSMGSDITVSTHLCLRSNSAYSFSLHDFVPGVAFNFTQFHIDSFFLIPINVPDANIFDTPMSPSYLECVSQYRRVITQSSANPLCVGVIFTKSTALYNGTLDCDCDVLGTQPGTVCQAFGGQCMCLPGVRGRRCDQCIPSFYNLTSTGCSSCDCNPIGSVDTYCDSVNGVCECVDNVVGRDCSVCAEGMRDVGDLQCAACNCNFIGSVGSDCDEVSGVCECKSGVTGTTCDQCSSFFYGFGESGCRPCNCSASGSVSLLCNIGDGQCSCAPNVMGRECLTCQQGTFDLQQNNPDGCQPCFCSGHSTVCSSASGYIHSSVSTVFNSLADDPLDGWIVQPSGSSALVTNDGISVDSSSGLRLSAPLEYLDNKRSSYGQYLQVRATALDENSTSSVLQAILVSSSFTLIADLVEIDDGLYVVQLHESADWMNNNTNNPITAFTFQATLSSLNALIIAPVNSVLILHSVSLDIAVLGEGEHVTWQEECACPTGYIGNSCEFCDTGFRRSDPGSRFCVPCDCNGFSSQCDAETGICFNCTQSTTGDFCDVCERGSFGDPLVGFSCNPCPCPLITPDGQFSEDCVLLSSGEALCTNCPSGHSGQFCESCRSGYFGDPTGNITGQPSMCTDCTCNGNIDQTDPLSCNATSGICIRCLNNTGGDFCERCANSYYGDAILVKNCTECQCDMNGSQSENCDDQSGDCPCLPNILGRTCDRCSPNFFGFGHSDGCAPCDCDPNGSVSQQCGSNGECSCLQGVTGTKCDRCLPGYFNFSNIGCTDCSCSPLNSQSATCEATGECICLPGSTGLSCNECITNYYMPDSGQKCTECPSCYQEIEISTNTTEMRLNRALNKFIILRENLNASELEPYGPRLLEKQQLVDNIVRVIETLNERKSNLTVQFNMLAPVVIQALQTQTTQVRVALDRLKSSATTVIVLAATSNELVDRIIFEFSTANEFLDIVRNELFPGIASLAQQINASFSNSIQARNSLLSNLNLVSSQVAELEYLIEEISQRILDSSDDYSLARQTLGINSVGVTSLTASSVSSRSDVFSLSMMVNDVYLRTQTLLAVITNFPTIPDSFDIELLSSLISRGDMIERYVSGEISAEISVQQTELSRLNQLLERRQAVIEDYLLQIETLENSTLHKSVTTNNLNSEVTALVSSTNLVISQAEIVLQNLQQFRNDSLLLSEEANVALQQVTSVSDSAAILMMETQALKVDLVHVSNQLEQVDTVCADVMDAITEIKQDILSFNSSSLLKIKSFDQSLALTTHANVVSLGNQVTDLQEELDAGLTELSSYETVVLENERDVNTSRTLKYQAITAVGMLQTAFEDLNLLDMNAVRSFEALVSQVNTDVSSANIDEVYEYLLEDIVQQRHLRTTLQNQVGTFQKQITYLKHIDTSLPPGCNS